MTTWLAVQSVVNWQADKRQGFTLYGMNERHRRAATSMRIGDRIVHYAIGGHFTGIREVVADGIAPLGRASHYDEPYPWGIQTKPIAVLPPFTWLPAKDLVGKMLVVKNPATGMSIFQASLKRIPNFDGELILSAILAKFRLLRDDPFAAATELRRTLIYRQAIRASGDPVAIKSYIDEAIEPPAFWRAVAIGGGTVPFLEWSGILDPAVAS